MIVSKDRTTLFRMKLNNNLCRTFTSTRRDHGCCHNIDIMIRSEIEDLINHQILRGYEKLVKI